MKSISIAGDLGSGKSSVAKKLCEILGYEYFSTGVLQRKMAQEKGMNTLELNYLAEQSDDIDNYIDAYLKNINTTDAEMVLDSRLAWHFVGRSFKVYLTVDPEVAAKRVGADSVRTNEPQANSTDEIVRNLLERQTVENRRFQKLYQVNCLDTNNYDLVIDASVATINEIAETIHQLFVSFTNNLPTHKYWYAPQSLYPTKNFVPLSVAEMQLETNGFEKVANVARVNSSVYLCNEHKWMSCAIAHKIPLVPVHPIDVSKEDLVNYQPNLKMLQEWENALHFRFNRYPH